jgi:hypothetical protein
MLRISGCFVALWLICAGCTSSEETPDAVAGDYLRAVERHDIQRAATLVMSGASEALLRPVETAYEGCHFTLGQESPLSGPNTRHYAVAQMCSGTARRDLDLTLLLVAHGQEPKSWKIVAFAIQR